MVVNHVMIQVDIYMYLSNTRVLFLFQVGLEVAGQTSLRWHVEGYIYISIYDAELKIMFSNNHTDYQYLWLGSSNFEFEHS